MRRCDGFTMVEILVVIVIIGILLRIATMQFSSMTSHKYIEKEAQQLESDINSVRTQAIFSKQRTAVSFPTGSSYAFSKYSTMNDAAGELTGTTAVKNALTASTGSSLAGQSILFDREGMASSTTLNLPFTIMVNPTNSGAVLDCVIIYNSRTNLGRMTNGTCVIK